ncbi:MAG: hypothetical protein ATN36_02890 [Epulopiscium sp. Nele67-Bin005]|nr:MAG: hypothetical protein ATN36_02890 [Epulopiscium sp. Nele67-Bin005]
MKQYNSKLSIPIMITLAFYLIYISLDYNTYQISGTEPEPEYNIALPAWLDVEVGTYHINSDGNLMRGVQEIDGILYNFDKETGLFLTGWVNNDHETYHFDKYGFPTIGWAEIDGQTYYFESNGKLVTDTYKGIFSIDENGVSTKNIATEDNFEDYLDFLLDMHGHTIDGAIFAIHSTLEYKYVPSSKNTQDDALYAINNHKGACFHYASLTYELISYLGFETNYILGTGRSGQPHAWVSVNLDGDTVYYDSLYATSPYTYDELIELGYKWDEI